MGLVNQGQGGSSNRPSVSPYEVSFKNSAFFIFGLVDL